MIVALHTSHTIKPSEHGHGTGQHLIAIPARRACLVPSQEVECMSQFQQLGSTQCNWQRKERETMLEGLRAAENLTD
jgi:hypothetical protein